MKQRVNKHWGYFDVLQLSVCPLCYNLHPIQPNLLKIAYTRGACKGTFIFGPAIRDFGEEKLSGWGFTINIMALVFLNISLDLSNNMITDDSHEC